jgi:hypothetical protein
MQITEVVTRSLSIQEPFKPGLRYVPDRVAKFMEVDS